MKLKQAGGSGIGPYRRGDVLTDITSVEPGQLLALDSKLYKSTNLIKVTQTFPDKFYALFVNPENPVEKRQASDEEFRVDVNSLGGGEYYIALEPSPMAQSPEVVKPDTGELEPAPSEDVPEVTVGEDVEDVKEVPAPNEKSEAMAGKKADLLQNVPDYSESRYRRHTSPLRQRMQQMPKRAPDFDDEDVEVEELTMASKTADKVSDWVEQNRHSTKLQALYSDYKDEPNCMGAVASFDEWATAYYQEMGLGGKADVMAHKKTSEMGMSRNTKQVVDKLVDFIQNADADDLATYILDFFGAEAIYDADDGRGYGSFNLTPTDNYSGAFGDLPKTVSEGDMIAEAQEQMYDADADTIALLLDRVFGVDGTYISEDDVFELKATPDYAGAFGALPMAERYAAKKTADGESEIPETDTKITYEEILPILQEKLDAAFEPIATEYELQEPTGEEVEHDYRDGFIPHTNGGYRVSNFTMWDYLTGSGKSLPVKSAQDELLKMEEQAYSEAKDWFAKEYPDIVEELGEDNIDYNTLYEKGYADEAEALSEAEHEWMNETVFFTLGAYYYDPENHHNETPGQQSLYMFYTVNLESPYHRTKYDHTVIDEDITFSTIEEMSQKVDAFLAKVSGGTSASKKIAVDVQGEPAGGGFTPDVINSTPDANPMTTDEPTEDDEEFTTFSRYEEEPEFTEDTEFKEFSSIEVRLADGSFDYMDYEGEDVAEAVASLYPDYDAYRKQGSKKWIKADVNSPEGYEFIIVDNSDFDSEDDFDLEDGDFNLEPNDDSIVINENEGVAYYAGRPIAEAKDIDELAELVYKWTESEGYYPDIWIGRERGDFDNVIIKKKGALDDYSETPVENETDPILYGSASTVASELLANIETLSSMPGGLGDDGSAYDLLDGTQYDSSALDNSEASLVVEEYLTGKATSLASLDDFMGFVGDAYGVPAETIADFKEAWHQDDATALTQAVIKNATRNDFIN